jgi:hypothetical protein
MFKAGSQTIRPKNEAERFEPVTCFICTRVHMVSPKTGKVLGEDDE